MQMLICSTIHSPNVYVATVTGRGMVHIPSALRKRYGIKSGDKLEFASGRDGIRIVRVPTLLESFGMDRELGLNFAYELLEEKKAELRREAEEMAAPRRVQRKRRAKAPF